VNHIVIAENLTRKFGDVTAVNNLNLQIAPGEIFALVGPDGAGKTTTMRLLCGLMDPTEGKCIVTDLDVSKNPDEVKDHIGYMAQRFGLYGDLTVQENLDFYADLFGILGAERDELSARLMKMTRMEPFRDRQAAKLSGGMKQKLALMCTLLHKPKVLFLDEPQLDDEDTGDDQDDGHDGQAEVDAAGRVLQGAERERADESAEVGDGVDGGHADGGGGAGHEQ